MFDPLLDEDPWVKGKVAEGELKGELKSSRGIFVNIVRRRFPSLVGFAETKAEQIDQPEALSILIDQILQVPDENMARSLLDVSQAS